MARVGTVLLLVLLIFGRTTAKEPFLDIPLFSIRDFTMGNIIGVFCYLPQMAVAFLLPFIWKRVKSLSTAFFRFDHDGTSPGHGGHRPYGRHHVRSLGFPSDPYCVFFF